MPELKNRKPYVALLLGLLSGPVAFLYVGRPLLAVGYVVVPLLVLCILGQSGLIFTLPGVTIAFTGIALLLVAGLIVPPLIARKVRNSYVLERYNRWYVYLLVAVTYGIGTLILLGHRGLIFGYEAFRIPTASMQNTLQIGDFIIADARDLTHLDRGQLITYRIYPEEKNY